MEEAGADAIKLNIYSIATEPAETGADVEKGYVDLVRQITRIVRIPVAVKLSQFFSASANIAVRLGEAGAGGVVLFNRCYQPDFDIESLEVVPRLTLSHVDELLLRLHWTAILFGHVHSDLAITAGVHNANRHRQVHNGGRSRGHDGFRVASPRHSSRCLRPRQSPALAGRARVRFYSANVRQHEPPFGLRSNGLRTRELYARAQLLYVSVRRFSKMNSSLGTIRGTVADAST